MLRDKRNGTCGNSDLIKEMDKTEKKHKSTKKPMKVPGTLRVVLLKKTL